jgi:hypothetical protein
LQIVAVDDRSTDNTGKLMDEVCAEAAAGNGQHWLQVLHLTELPEGWMGKPHALARAAEHATAPWLLFTDGDVSFAPRALELALRTATAEKADHFALMLTLIRHDVSEAVMEATVQALAQWSFRLWKVSDSRALDSFGAGGFNMVRTEVFKRLGGMTAMRMEVVEDLSLASMVKRAGGRSIVALGLGLANIRWIQGAFGIVGNVEKNGFAVFRYRPGLAFAAGLGLAIQITLPLAAIAAGGWTTVAGLLTYAGIALTFHANRRLNQVPAMAAILFAPAVAIIGYGLVRSMILTLKRNGVIWRGTFYPLSELRRNAVRWH